MCSGHKIFTLCCASFALRKLGNRFLDAQKRSHAPPEVLSNISNTSGGSSAREAVGIGQELKRFLFLTNSIQLP